MADQRLSSSDVTRIFSALSQETRLEAYRLLLRYQPFGLAAGDIARLLSVPHNTLSTHLAALQAAGLIRSRRDGRTVIYAADPSKLAATEEFLGHRLTAKRLEKGQVAGNILYPTRRPEDGMSDKAHNVLILCTGNSARSILAEAIIDREGAGRFRAYSAGSQPKAKPNPIALELLSDLGYVVSRLRSKSWTEFSGRDAPKMDFIITVCDSAAGQACPVWPGHPLTAHWGIPDPAEVKGTTEQKRAAFEKTYRWLMHRITTFVNLPVDRLTLSELKVRLADIGKMEGATDTTLHWDAA